MDGKSPTYRRNHPFYVQRHYDDRMSNLVCTTVDAYWNELKGDAIAPRRSDIDPRRLENALEHMFILEDLGGDLIRTRLAGTRLADMFDGDVRGRDVSELFTQHHQLKMTSMFRQIFDGPAQADLELRLSSSNADIAAQMTLRPLTDDAGYVTRILGCLVIQKDTLTRHDRLEPTNLKLTNLGQPTLEYDYQPKAELELAEQLPQYRTADHTPPIGRATSVPFLRIVSNEG